MINKVVLVGRLTKDPELRYTPAGVAVTRFTLAVNRSFSNQQGEREADFVSCVVWRKPAENVANFLKKGSLAGVDGRIQTGSYEGQDGKRVYTTEVVCDSVQFLERKGNSEEKGNGQGNEFNNRGQQPASQGNFNNQNISNGSFNQQNNNSQQFNTGYDELFEGNGPSIDISDDDLPF